MHMRTSFDAARMTRPLYRHLRGTMLHAADTLKDEIQDAISIDVEYVAGWVVRSLPGEPPRRETGELYRSFRVGTDAFSSAPATYVTSTSEYVLALELGRPDINLAPRPHVTVTFLAHAGRLGWLILQPMP